MHSDLLPETGFRELKTFLRGPRRVLRSRDPAGIEQETWALLSAHQLLAATRTCAARQAGTDPDRVSYTVTLHAVRRQITTTTPPASATPATTGEILSQLLPATRRNRTYPRATTSSTATRRTARLPDSHLTYTITITTPTGPSPLSTRHCAGATARAPRCG